MSDKCRLESFWNWAEEERQKRDLSWYAVEREAGVANATVSRRASNMSDPTVTTCEAIAKAFGLSKEYVMRRAGILRDLPDEMEEERELYYRIRDLDREERARVAEYLQFLDYRRRSRDRAGAPTLGDLAEADA
jgi:transcriptional regulator with XRE-family HTH domain